MALPKLTVYSKKYANIKTDPQGRFWVDAKIEGKRYRKLAGSRLSDAKSLLREAQSAAAKRRAQPPEEKPSRPTQASLADLAEHFKPSTWPSLSESTRASYEGSDKHLQRFFKDRPVRGLTMPDIYDFRASRLAEGAAPKSVNLDLQRLRLLLNLAEGEDFIARSPLNKQRVMLPTEHRVRYLTKTEQDALEAICREHDPEAWPAIQFAFLTGLRAREQWRLTWEQVGEGWLRVKRPKTSTRDHLPIRATVAQILEGQRGLHERWVWPGKMRVGPIDHDNWNSRRFTPLVEAAGIEDLHWHDLRHTFCSRLVMAGKPLEVVRALAGHSSLSTTLKYAHLSPDYLASALDALEDF